jgi:imidazolonepropionase-like amidohydrolase
MELGATIRAVKSRRVLLGDVIQPAVIYVRDGKIQSVRPGSALSADEESCEVGSCSNNNQSSVFKFPFIWSFKASQTGN